MLGGCVTLLPKSKPAQLYQFGRNVGVSTERPSTPVAGPVGLRLSTGFTQRGGERPHPDRLGGSETAYIAEARLDIRRQPR